MKGCRCLPKSEGRCAGFIKETVSSQVNSVFFEEKNETCVLPSFILFPLCLPVVIVSLPEVGGRASRFSSAD